MKTEKERPGDTKGMKTQDKKVFKLSCYEEAFGKYKSKLSFIVSILLKCQVKSRQRI